MNKPLTHKDFHPHLPQLEPPSAAPAPAAEHPHGHRKQLLGGLAAAVLTGGLAVGAYQVLVGSHHAVTDNAYVGADVAQVTPLVGGPVAQVRVADTQAVHAGDVLLVIDDTDARLALEQATAALGQAERRVRGYLATDDALAAQVAARAADAERAAAQVASAEADVANARLELARRQALAQSGAVAGEELTRARTAADQAAAALQAARAALAQAKAAQQTAAGQLSANSVLTDGATVETNPEVAAARARVDQARVDLQRTVIRAPIDGVVTHRQVQVGQKVAPGAPLMSIVPVAEVYVDANFKEVQLGKVRPGQPATLTSDLYGPGVRFHGRVTGLSGGTGSAFAVIPAQNATGNWIKVVQRVPVRIALDPAELAKRPLRVGLSMTADIDLTGGDRS
ncbi:MAG TPA: HlyD family efflux transporter periplasmic adaptor subunit [Caulobacteraceae bacterium]|nr:HlyD family efflux transporter periplasmic adaptor subunit [Caulobacteraceae bacterium]